MTHAPRFMPLLVAATLLTLALVPGCAPPRPALADYHRLDLPAHSDSSGLDYAVRADLLRELRSGDIVLGVKEDPITALVRLTTVEPTYFTHSGTIEVVRDARGEPAARVWHAIGDFNLLHLSPHILGKVRGGVRSAPFDEFIRMYDALAIVRLPDEAKNRAMIDVCRRLHDAKIEFDPFVDCLDDSTICCTELTALAIQGSGYEMNLKPAPRTRDAALSGLMTGWNITTPAIYMAGQFERLPGARTVAVLARYGRMETYLAMRDASALLHERLSIGELKAGDLCGFDARRLAHFPPRMELFLRGVEGLAIASPTSDGDVIRRRNDLLIETIFRPRSRDPQDE